ncbi:glycine-rich RNA-binding protein GRP1A-like [Punica granatum]|uniref:Glycine-rich RNA-binding protein GRP1A-like n=1 Tax=Punica granatum TaxID=22663 RepID=A0A6P8C6S2_PUNGR|nr:glycine-rich RNA-binding protein GRP1A-like [Punica granatum]
MRVLRLIYESLSRISLVIGCCCHDLTDVEYCCFVGCLVWATDDQSPERAFNAHGEIVDLKIINDREIERSRGLRFITFVNEKSIRDAIKGMNNQNLDGKSIIINEAQSPSGSGNRCGCCHEGGGSGYNLSGGRYGGNGGGRDCGYNDELSLHEFLYRVSVT